MLRVVLRVLLLWCDVCLEVQELSKRPLDHVVVVAQICLKCHRGTIKKKCSSWHQLPPRQKETMVVEGDLNSK